MDLSKEMLVDIAINIINILVLFFVVRKLAYKPVKKFMDERTAKVTAEKENALRLSEECEEKIGEYNKLLKESEKAKEESVKEGIKEAEKQSAVIIGEARKKAELITVNAEKKAEDERKKLMEEAKSDIISLVFDASEKVLCREVNDEDNKKAVEDFLNSFEGQGDLSD